MATLKRSTNPNTKITGDAKAIISGVLSWLNDPTGTKHCTITGGPGAGKTWLIKELLATHENFMDLGIGTREPITVSATTHDSLAVIQRALQEGGALRTIYSQLELVPVNSQICKRVGKFKKPATYMPKPEEVITDVRYYICDESNFMSEETVTIIENWFPNVKIIFIGSENQLGTGSGKSLIFTQGWDNFYLNTSFRAGNADVQAVYDSSEEDVINEELFPRYVTNPSIEYLTGPAWEDTIRRAYASPVADKCITLAYTNKRVYELVGMIRESQGKSGHYDKNEPRQALRAGSPLIAKKNIAIETDNNGLDYIPIPVQNPKKGRTRSYIAQSYEHYEYLCGGEHRAIRREDEIYPSLIASMEASTIHGAQGGTWDYTFLDFDNMATVKRYDMETFRRMKHVAESRHTTKIFIKSTQG